MEHPLEKAGELTENGFHLHFWSAGEKITEALLNMGIETSQRFSLPASVSGIDAQIQAVVQQIESYHHAQGIEHFYVCHNLLSKGGAYEHAFYRILPLDEEWAQSYVAIGWPGRCLPLMGLPQQQMFAHLFRHYLFVSFYRAFAQSLAGENAARLMAMQAAEKNIVEMREHLLGLFREQRQAGITNELLDIISGFEALSGDGVPV